MSDGVWLYIIRGENVYMNIYFLDILWVYLLD